MLLHSIIKKTFQILLLSLISISCSNETKTDSNLLKKDIKELEESLDSYKVTTYKFGKIVLRAAVSKDTTSKELVAFRSNIKNASDMLMKYDFENPETLSVLDYLTIYREYKKMEKYILKTDEDVFPTLTEAYSIIHGDGINKEIVFRGTNKEYIQNVEHAILSAIVVLSKDLGKEISLYECSKTKPELLPDTEIKTLLQYLRGFLFSEKGFYYLSEDEISKNIEWLNNNKTVDLPYTRAMFKWGNLDNEQTHIGFLSLNHLFRGFDRLMMDREIDEKRALEDFEVFLKNTKKLGLDNEIIWSIETYLYLKNEENEKAINALTKLKTSSLLSAKEKEQIDKSIVYLQQREPDKVLNGYYDKYFLSKIASEYMFSILAQVDWKKILKEQGVPHTKEMFETIDRFKVLNEKLNAYSTTEKLEEVENSIKDKSKNIWINAKKLIE